MSRRLALSAQQAVLSLVSRQWLCCRARPPGVRHEDFQAELRRRYSKDAVELRRGSLSSIHSDMGPVADFLAKQHAFHHPASPCALCWAHSALAREHAAPHLQSCDFQHSTWLLVQEWAIIAAGPHAIFA